MLEAVDQQEIHWTQSGPGKAHDPEVQDYFKWDDEDGIPSDDGPVLIMTRTTTTTTPS